MCIRDSVFAARASPIYRPGTKNLTLSPPSTVHGGQYVEIYTRHSSIYVLHAAFVADTIWGVQLQPAVVMLLCRVSTVRVQPRNRVIDDADYTVLTRQ